MPDSPIIWRRTEFEGIAGPCDFMATVEGKGVGRIRRIPYDPNKGCWRWSFTLSVPGIPYSRLPPLHGIAQTKAEAVERIRWALDLIRGVKAQVDIAEGRPPVGILDSLCSAPGCTKPGGGTPDEWLCYEHRLARKRMAG